ncbi:MAG: NUDIX domain-containing protein [Parcubacteria group bacterium]|jgi:isopentenyldiphosphate isomerase
MAEEFLDIVSENNELTGESAPRSKVHAEGLWHRTVHVYLFRKNNDDIDFLIHLRSPLKEHNPNKLATSFGGHIKAGETLEQGTKAELQEEIGLEIDYEKLLGGYWRKRDNPDNREQNVIYYLEFNGALEDLQFNDGEVQEVKWMSVEEVKNSMRKNPKAWAGKIDGFIEKSDYLKEIL